MSFETAIVMAGIPATNKSLYHRLRFSVGDPAAWIQLRSDEGRQETVLILRDIEMQRARQHVAIDRVSCPADFTPDQGLSGDRETATAQSVAECLRRNGVQRVVADRSLPLIFAEMIRQAGITVTCDTEFGIQDRRRKDEQEIAWLREAQQVTEQCVAMACRMVAKATSNAAGALHHDGGPLTCDRVRRAIDIWLLERGYTNPISIVAGGPQGADCHNHGEGQLWTGQPVIIDVFPLNQATNYNGDCTRTVVHGVISDQLAGMHRAVLAAKASATAMCRAGVTGEAVHEATIATIREHGFEIGLPSDDTPEEYCAMTHGTGHGIGLDVHEPPLLDFNGPELVVGDALTIEPGLYSRGCGGVRVEDMVIVTADGCDNLNSIPAGLDWA